LKWFTLDLNLVIKKKHPGFPKEKKWQATHIAPLQPPILAAFRPWGGSAGAGRVRPADANIGKLEGSEAPER
jgi:hypothetical protein